MAEQFNLQTRLHQRALRNCSPLGSADQQVLTNNKLIKADLHASKFEHEVAIIKKAKISSIKTQE
jgi:hypothetical protein